MPPYVAMLNPKQLMPGLGFFNCDQLVASDETTSMFQQRLAANAVICLAQLVGGGIDLRIHHRVEANERQLGESHDGPSA